MEREREGRILKRRIKRRKMIEREGRILKRRIKRRKRRERGKVGY